MSLRWRFSRSSQELDGPARSPHLLPARNGCSSPDTPTNGGDSEQLDFHGHPSIHQKNWYHEEASRAALAHCFYFLVGRQFGCDMVRRRMSIFLISQRMMADTQPLQGHLYSYVLVSVCQGDGSKAEGSSISEW